jgi:isopentenyl diphosphate isomerase/L-lactate dehydrogenase-like FMN-dependent dehydrogenase
VSSRGQAGVALALDIMRKEFEISMALSGSRRASGIGLANLA